VLIDFWTYTCINCIRTLPYLRAWDREYRDDGLTIVGVHAPEFVFERDADNVAAAIESNELAYPVVQDNEFGTWDAFGNRYWPAKYLIDADGRVRFAHFGEGSYEQTEAAIRSLLAQAGDGRVGDGVQGGLAETADPRLRTPETYLGAERARGWVERPLPGTDAYEAPATTSLGLNEFALGGTWRVDGESATAASDATIGLSFQARRVFLVLGATEGGGEVEVLLDGKPITERNAGADVRDGVARIAEQRLYRLVDLPRAGRHSLELRLSARTTGYAFTFG
jgi:thiol-disulfide isomerase/thioredoxin